nr:DUF4158 domain-containing protein [Streptomyces xanthophaeus]
MGHFCQLRSPLGRAASGNTSTVGIGENDHGCLAQSSTLLLGFAPQMCMVRYVGLFLEGLLAVPWPVVERLAVQLGIGDPSVVKRYTERRQAGSFTSTCGRSGTPPPCYRPTRTARGTSGSVPSRTGGAWTHAKGPKAVFDPAVGRLRRHLVLLPGVSGRESGGVGGPGGGVPRFRGYRLPRGRGPRGRLRKVCRRLGRRLRRGLGR